MSRVDDYDKHRKPRRKLPQLPRNISSLSNQSREPTFAGPMRTQSVTGHKPFSHSVHFSQPGVVL